MDRTTIAELIRRCCRVAEFDIEQSAATFVAREQFQNLDAARLADHLGSLERGRLTAARWLPTGCIVCYR